MNRPAVASAGGRDQAVEAHRRAIEVEPVSPLNYFEIGKIQVSQGSSGEAESSLRKAIAYEPNFLPARVLLTEVLLKKGDLMGAMSEYDTMIAIKKRYEGRILNATEHRYLAVNLKPLAQTFELKPQ